MSAKCQQVINWMNQWAPPSLAEDDDRIGLQVGNPGVTVSRLLVTLEVTAAVVEEAVQSDVQLIVAHHPLIYRQLVALRSDSYPANLVTGLITHGIAMFNAHTNLDAANGGINDLLAEYLQLEAVEILAPSYEKMFKLVVFIPRGCEEKVRLAICDSGAGGSGKYSESTFRTSGTGTFRPLPGAAPFIGKIGELEQVDEVRLETIIPEGKVAAVIKAMTDAHPYEEVAYDLYPLCNRGQSRGLGRVGNLPIPATLGELARLIKGKLGQQVVKVTGEPERVIKRVALCGGSAMSLFSHVLRSRADLYLTGDIKHHDALDAAGEGIALIDAGHYGTERVIVPAMASYLKTQALQEGAELEVLESGVCTDPFSYY